MKATLTLLPEGKMVLGVPNEILDNLELEEIKRALEKLCDWGAGKTELLLLPFPVDIIDMREHE